MTILRLATASVVVYLIAGCSSSGTTGPQTGTVAGTVSSSLGQVLSNVTVTVTPSGQSALTAVQTTSNGSYSVASVPVGSGSVAVTGVPSNCTAPAASSYSGLTGNATQTVNIQVTCTPPTGSLNGTITSSATNAGIANASVTVTPSGASALPAVMTNAQGQYNVTNIPVGPAQVAIGNLPNGCTPGTGNVTISAGANGPVDYDVQCTNTTGATTTTLDVGQTALFTSSPSFATNLTIAGNDVYLMAIINTDSASSELEDVTVSGGFTATSASRVGPLRLAAARLQPPVRPTPLSKLMRKSRVSAARPRVLDPRFERDLHYLRTAEEGHVARLERDAQDRLRLGRVRIAGRSPARFSLASTNIGDVNPINVPVPSCTNFATIGARTVYVGQHVQIVADTSLTNWPAQYRPDSSYYTTLGLEYDTLTYAKHLLTYIGDPLEYDNQLSNVGKVTIVLTPVLNGESTSGTQGGGTILAFVTGCDFLPTSQAPSSNGTEMIYHLVPSANYSVGFWEREIRPTLAHESKHIVSIGEHLFNAPFFEQVWLEEGLAQISSEIWGRNYNNATWKGNAGFAETLGCEVTGYPAACNTATSPYTFVESHMAWLEQYLQTQDSVLSQTLNGSTPGRYGAGWSIARWTIDQYTTGTSPSAEASMVKALITDYSATGLANIANVTGSSPAQTLAYWNLAVGLDTVSLLDSSTFNIGQITTLATVPSFDYRNIFSVAGNGQLYPLAAPLRPAVVPAGPIDAQATGVAGTDAIYLEVVGGSTAGTQFLQLLSGSGGTISPSSGFRVAIIRIH